MKTRAQIDEETIIELEKLNVDLLKRCARLESEIRELKAAVEINKTEATSTKEANRTWKVLAAISAAFGFIVSKTIGNGNDRH